MMFNKETLLATILTTSSLTLTTALPTLSLSNIASPANNIPADLLTAPPRDQSIPPSNNLSPISGPRFTPTNVRRRGRRQLAQSPTNSNVGPPVVVVPGGGGGGGVNGPPPAIVQGVPGGLGGGGGGVTDEIASFARRQEVGGESIAAGPAGVKSISRLQNGHGGGGGGESGVGTGFTSVSAPPPPVVVRRQADGFKSVKGPGPSGGEGGESGGRTGFTSVSAPPPFVVRGQAKGAEDTEVDSVSSSGSGSGGSDQPEGVAEPVVDSPAPAGGSSGNGSSGGSGSSSEAGSSSASFVPSEPVRRRFEGLFDGQEEQHIQQSDQQEEQVQEEDQEEQHIQEDQMQKEDGQSMERLEEEE